MVFTCEKFQHGSLKKWSMPFCAFFTTFTVVMTILVLSIDLRGPHYIRFNATNIYDFENTVQDSPRLVGLIRRKYLHPPAWSNSSMTLVPSEQPTLAKPFLQILKVFRKKRGGIYVECGASGSVDGFSWWLEMRFGWRGLLTQPHPADYSDLVAQSRPASHTANVCISPTKYPKQAWFRNSSLEDGTSRKYLGLYKVQCFPLYSLLLAYNTTSVDLLIFNLLNAQLQVLKTLPFKSMNVKVIVLLSRGDEGSNGEEDPCCSLGILQLLEAEKFKLMSKLNQPCFDDPTPRLANATPNRTMSRRICYFIKPPLLP